MVALNVIEKMKHFVQFSGSLHRLRTNLFVTANTRKLMEKKYTKV